MAVEAGTAYAALKTDAISPAIVTLSPPPHYGRNLCISGKALAFHDYAAGAVQAGVTGGATGEVVVQSINGTTVIRRCRIHPHIS